MQSSQPLGSEQPEEVVDGHILQIINFGYKIQKKWSKAINKLDNQVTINFKTTHIETRPVKSNGLWCCLLIPTTLLIYNMLYNVPPVYKVATYVSIGMLVYSLLFIIFISISCLVIKEPLYGGCWASGLLSAILLYTCMKQGILISLILSLPPVYTYSMLLKICLVSFPKTFTVGELMMSLQGIILFWTAVFAKNLIKHESDEETTFVNTVVVTVLSTVALIVTALFFLPEHEQNLKQLTTVMAGGALYASLSLFSALGFTFPFQLCYYIFRDIARVQLFFLWLILLLMAIVLIAAHTKIELKTNTVTRKVFHVLASVVFLTGMTVDVQFIKLASGIGFALLILVEAIRQLKIQPLSPALQKAFLLYRDEKDCGVFAMTAVYMYAALAAPLLLVPEHRGTQLERLAGVLAVGVGDTAASWFGEHYGRLYWPAGSKTIEGTLFNVLAQLVTVYLLTVLELLNVNYPLIRTAVAATIAALVEARTEQVDNLVLPVVMIIAYQVTFMLV